MNLNLKHHFIIIMSSWLFGCSAGFKATSDGSSLTTSLSSSPSAPLASPTPFAPQWAMLLGANGSPGGMTGLGLWSQMGLRFARVEIGSIAATDAQDFASEGYFAKDSDATILLNNANGISSVILMDYTANFNESRAGDSYSPPIDDSQWTDYVNAIVQYYSAPPFNVKYFQIWNEAAGSLTGGSAQATFWQSPTGSLDQPYATAMQDYVNLIHIPAAKIVRSYGAYVVYGGWPDQGGLGTYEQWLEYQSPNNDNQTMLDWTDYLDLHYLWSSDMNTIYSRYVSTGKVRGIWQTEVGFSYMDNVTYLPDLLFNVAIMALTNGWTDPDQFVIFPYHWDGPQPFMLTDGTTLHEPGTSLVTMKNLMTGTLSLFTGTLSTSQGSSAVALYSGNQLIIQIAAASTSPGVTTVTATTAAPANGYTISFVDAVYGKDYSSSITSSSWSGDTLNIQINMPGGFTDLASGLDNFMGYVVLTPK